MLNTKTKRMSIWHALWSIPGNGQRYYLVPMAMLLFGLAILVGRGKAPLCRAIGTTFLLLIAAMGARVDWVLTPTFTDFHFRHYVDLYRSLPPGASVIVPINPPGWNMMPRIGVVRKKATALCPYHHCTSASWTPPKIG